MRQESVYVKCLPVRREERSVTVKCLPMRREETIE